MERITSKITILAIFLAAGASLHAGEPLPIRNCTWCHGTAAQGFTTAPRLAGQRQQYITNQLLDFNRHTRDNPLSKQYMWAAAENLNPQIARDLALYFSTLPPRAANDGDSELAARGKEIYELGIANSNVVACVVCSWAQGRRHQANTPAGRLDSFLSEEAPRAVGPGISCNSRAYAPNRQHLVSRRH